MTQRNREALHRKGVPVDFLERFCEAFGFPLKAIRVVKPTKPTRENTRRTKAIRRKTSTPKTKPDRR